MGSCVSLHKERQSAMPMELRLSVEPKNEKLLIASPVKQKPVTVNGVDYPVTALAVKSQFHDADLGLNASCLDYVLKPIGVYFERAWKSSGSKEEAFFDSQPWLESDGEDDFLSVNGDFTPSRGTTPVHHRLSSGNPTMNKALVEGPLGSVREPLPSDKKKRLSDLFKESLRREHVYDENEASDESVVVEKETSNERTPNRAQCCLPGFRSNRSFSEKKRKMSPQ